MHLLNEVSALRNKVHLKYTAFSLLLIAYFSNVLRKSKISLSRLFYPDHVVSYFRMTLGRSCLGTRSTDHKAERYLEVLESCSRRRPEKYELVKAILLTREDSIRCAQHRGNFNVLTTARVRGLVRVEEARTPFEASIKKISIQKIISNSFQIFLP